MAKNKTLEAIVQIAGSIDPSLAKSIAGATKQFSGLKVGVAAVGTAAVAATAAAVKFGADAVKSAAAFETKMKNVGTLLDGTTEQVNKRLSELGDDVLKVSNSTGIATDELTDGLYQIISAVGDSEDSIKQMEVAAKAAASGGATTTDAINLLTAVTKGYGDTSNEAFQKASDLSFMTVKLGQTSFPELAASMGKVVPIASALNVSQEELYGAFATLTGVTGSTAEVSTQMKAVMSGLMTPSKNMTDALNKLGYSNATAALESLGFQETLQALSKTVGGDTQLLAKMFSSVEAQTAVLALAGSQADNLTEKTQAMYEATGATDRAFGIQTDTLEYTIQVIKNLGTNFMTEVGRKILPTVKNVAQKVLPMIQDGLDNIGPVVDRIYQALSPVIEIAGKAIGQVLPIFQKMLEGGMSLFEKIGPVIQKIGEQLLPVLSMAIQAVGDMLSSIELGKFAEDLFSVVGTVIQALIPILSTLCSALSPILKMAAQLVNSLLPAIMSRIKLFVPAIQLLASIISSYIGNVLSYTIPIIQNVINVISGLLDFITNVFTGNWSVAWENVKSIFSNAFQALVGIAKAPLNGVISLINGVISGINNVGFKIPDWVPVLGGKDFRINIPQIPMLATGGFTTGPSIAGEAGTEAVISFNNAYRDENLSTWAKAGRMLGVDDTLINALVNSGRGSSGNNITFAPNITVQGNASKSDILEALRENEAEFMDLLEEFFEGRGPVYG